MELPADVEAWSDRIATAVARSEDRRILAELGGTMSTYYELQCPTCQEAGGFFSRQAWGWGNADIIETFKFLMAHAECRAVDLEYDRQSAIEVVGEHESNYGNKAWRAKFEENIESGRAADMWPRADEWEWMAASIAAKEPLSDAWAKWKERWRAARKEREGIT